MEINKLSELDAKHAKPRKKECRLSDGGGLYRVVTPNGGKLLRWSYEFNGKEKLLSYGPYPAATLARAREPGIAHHSPINLDLHLADWSTLLRQRKMRSIFVIIPDILVHQAFQMTFIHNDHMVEQITAAIADPALSDTVLPWALEARPLWLDTEALCRVDHFFIELRAAIEDQITRRGVVSKCLTQLLNKPSARRVLCDVAVQDSPPIMRNDEEAVQNAEGECRNSEEVHRLCLVKSTARICPKRCLGESDSPGDHTDRATPQGLCLHCCPKT